ncbi:MAG TPA: hypothetical protein VJT74_16750 [Pyrinomonadaceae bacterium]|nr:hypothetical protein [Pyrinomonadaceae bacterium]
MKNVRLKDGTIVKPEVQLVDQYGNVFDAGVQMAASPSDNNGSITGYVPRLPRDRLYTKVRVRSDKPLKVSRIFWRCSTYK